MDEILQDFISETAETMEDIGGEIVAWEANPGDRERLDTIFRFVHTVKGSCGFLNLARIGALSHAAEDALDAVRQGKRHATPGMVSAVLAIIDRIVELTEALAATGHEPEGSDDNLVAALADDADAGASPTASTETVAPAQHSQGWRTIRVPLHLLDTIMNGVSDMVLARNEVARLIRSGSDPSNINNAFDRLSSSVAEMRNSVSQMRMQRIEKLFAPLPRMVRDLSQDLGKKCEVVIDGGEVEIDREMIEMIRDPLTHIVRNAIDHGMESPDERKAAGKPECGTLRVNARQSGNQIMVEVRDDGAGISIDRLVAKAIAAKIVTEKELKAMSAKEKLDLIFSPGLSTAHAVTSISGRGVGMDVVRSNIERIGGIVDLENTEGEGLTVMLRVPLTLTIISGLTVSANAHLFAIPRASVSEIILQASETVRIDRAGGAEIAIVRGERLSLVYLEDVLGIERSADDDADRSIVITRGNGGCRYALSVADVYDHEELVIKPAAPGIMATGLYAGTTLPDNGKPMLLLDTAGISAAANVVADSDEGSGQVGLAAAAAANDNRGDNSVLLLREFDGSVRGIRLSVIERVDDIPATAIHRNAGTLRALVGDQLIPIYDCELPATATMVKLLRLNDGEREIGYMMSEVVDTGYLPSDIDIPAKPGLIGGIAILDGHPVEIIDPFWLFANTAAKAGRNRRPVCRLAGRDDHWTRQFLAPLVTAAGYDVVFDTESKADLIIAGADDGDFDAAGDSRIVRLRSAEEPQGKTDDSIYRYDQSAILAALATGTEGK